MFFLVRSFSIVHFSVCILWFLNFSGLCFRYNSFLYFVHSFEIICWICLLSAIKATQEANQSTSILSPCMFVPTCTFPLTSSIAVCKCRLNMYGDSKHSWLSPTLALGFLLLWKEGERIKLIAFLFNRYRMKNATWNQSVKNPGRYS